MTAADSGDEGGDELALGLFGPRRSSWSSLSPLQAASPVKGDDQPADFDEVILNLYKPGKRSFKVGQRDAVVALRLRTRLTIKRLWVRFPPDYGNYSLPISSVTKHKSWELGLFILL